MILKIYYSFKKIHFRVIDTFSQQPNKVKNVRLRERVKALFKLVTSGCLVNLQDTRGSQMEERSEVLNSNQALYVVHRNRPLFSEKEKPCQSPSGFSLFFFPEIM